MHKPNKLLRITISAVTVVYSVLLFNLDLHLDSFGKRVVAALPMIGTIALWLWDSFIWKLPIIQSLTKRPNIKGLWEVTLTPHEDSHIPPGGNRGPIKAYMEIDQSYWQVDVTLFTKESHSDLVSFFLGFT